MKGRKIQPLDTFLLQRNATVRNPLLFTIGIHLSITIIIFLPTSFFHINPTPEIYSVELVDLSEPQSEPEPVREITPRPISKPKPVTEPAISTKPVLSTRNIPRTPTEIKILRPRKIKKDLRKDQPPIDQTMVFAALQRLKKQEQEQRAKKELEQANEAVEKANQEVLQAVRDSILARQPVASSEINTSTDSGSAAHGNNSLQSGQQAHSILTQYIATIGHHIGQYWRLPEGQKWDTTLNATVIVKIKPDGIVTSADLYKSSRSKQFDKFVIETIEKASPLPPIPAELEYRPLKLHFYPAGLQ
jgi:TonB family protein